MYRSSWEHMSTFVHRNGTADCRGYVCPVLADTNAVFQSGRSILAALSVCQRLSLSFPSELFCWRMVWWCHPAVIPLIFNSLLQTKARTCTQGLGSPSTSVLNSSVWLVKAQNLHLVCLGGDGNICLPGGLDVERAMQRWEVGTGSMWGCSQPVRS